MTKLLSISLNATLLLILILPARASDWTEWRGPARDGISPEKSLPTSWSPSGQNLAWKAPYGGRSAPIVMNGRVYLQNTAGKGADEQERIMCFDADTGKLLWEHRFNVYLSDVPPQLAIPRLGIFMHLESGAHFSPYRVTAKLSGSDRWVKTLDC